MTIATTEILATIRHNSPSPEHNRGDRVSIFAILLCDEAGLRWMPKCATEEGSDAGLGTFELADIARMCEAISTAWSFAEWEFVWTEAGEKLTEAVFA
jgi:hypothetical protein